MSDALAIVDQILDEHKEIHASFKSLGQVSNDIQAAARLEPDKTKEFFAPRGLDGESAGLARWKESLEALDRGLKAHFRKEETALTAAFEREGTPELAESLRQLLAEHAEINKHIAKLLKDADGMASGGLMMEVWESKGWGMKVNIENLQKQISEHAERERELLGRMKAHLQKN